MSCSHQMRAPPCRPVWEMWTMGLHMAFGQSESKLACRDMQPGLFGTVTPVGEEEGSRPAGCSATEDLCSRPVFRQSHLNSKLIVTSQRKRSMVLRQEKVGGRGDG